MGRGPTTMEVLDTTTDELLELVAHERRRAVLDRLIESDDGTASVAELADVIAGRAGSSDPDRFRAEVKLHHHHLPQLERAGVVEYESGSVTVRYRPDARLERLLEFVAVEL